MCTVSWTVAPRICPGGHRGSSEAGDASSMAGTVNGASNKGSDSLKVDAFPQNLSMHRSPRQPWPEPCVSHLHRGSCSSLLQLAHSLSNQANMSVPALRIPLSLARSIPSLAHPVRSSESALHRKGRYNQDEKADKGPDARDPRIHLVVAVVVHGTKSVHQATGQPTAQHQTEGNSATHTTPTMLPESNASSPAMPMYTMGTAQRYFHDDMRQPCVATAIKTTARWNRA